MYLICEGQQWPFFYSLCSKVNRPTVDVLICIGQLLPNVLLNRSTVAKYISLHGSIVTICFALLIIFRSTVANYFALQQLLVNSYHF